MKTTFTNRPRNFSKGLALFASLLFFGPSSHAEVGKTCLDPLMEAINKAEESRKKPITYSIQAPVECQYFSIGELDPETRTRIFNLIKSQGKVAGLDTKLTTVFGLLKLTPSAALPVQKKFDPCEAIFLDLSEKKKKFMGMVANAPDRKACFKLSSQFLNELKKFPAECDVPIELTTPDFQDLYAELNHWYQQNAMKPLPPRVSFAFNELKGLVGKMINGKCGSMQ